MASCVAEQPCGRGDCPVVRPGDIDRRKLRVHTLPARSERYRASELRFGTNIFTPEGMGNGRFSRLTGRANAYVAEQRSAAILESALHEAAGPNPRIYAAILAQYAVHRLRFVQPVRLIDLREPELQRLGIEPAQFTAASALHYPCTQATAQWIVGAKDTVGITWTSRQGALHAERNRDGLAAEVLRHQSLDVAVVYKPDHIGKIALLDSEPLVVGGEPNRFVVELANLLRIAIL